MRAWALVVVIAAGCGGGGGSPVALADVPAKFVEGLCTFAVRCHQFPDMATCKTVTFSNANQEVTSVNAGKASYDAALAGDCLAILSNMSCSRAGLLDDLNTASCRDTFQGKVVTGGACFADIECAGHGNCKFATGCNTDTTCCVGTCEASSAGAAGQPCASSGEQCVVGTYCKTTGTGTGTCTTRLTTAGAACDKSDACAPPLACSRTTGATGTATCVKLPGEGETCDTTTSPNCDLVFDTCDPTSKKCIRLPSLGQTCTGQCLGDAQCQGGTCVAKGALGAPCGMNNQPACAGELDCTSDHCAVPTIKATCM